MAVATDVFLDRAWGIAYDLKSFPSADGLYLIGKDIEKGSLV